MMFHGLATLNLDSKGRMDGRSIPGTFADVSELVEIAAEVGPRNGLMQAVGASFEVLEAIADTANSRVLFSYGTAPEKGAGTTAAEKLDKLCEGRDVTAISHVRGSGFMFGLQSALPVKGEAWNELREMSFEDRLSAVNDDDMAQRLVDEAKLPKASRVPMAQVFYLGSKETPDYTSDKNLKELAADAGEHWSETFLRLNREMNGRALFNFRMFATSLAEQANLFKSDNLYPGLGDAGAHVSQIMDAGWSSFMLSYWTRERGEFTLPEVIRKMTSGPARVIGLTDRAILKEGMRADVNVFDIDTVSECQPELVHDFPGGAPRYIQRSRGYRATIVNGQVNVLEGEHTGVRAGHVLRHHA